MKVIHTFSIGAAMMGMTCLFGAVPAANSGQGDRMTDSTQIAQVGVGTSGTGSGTTGGMPSGGSLSSLRRPQAAAYARFVRRTKKSTSLFSNKLPKATGTQNLQRGCVRNVQQVAITRD